MKTGRCGATKSSRTKTVGVKPGFRGRPRNEAAHVAVLQAVAEIARVEPLNAITMEGIAATAGVSKQTLYRWWGSKIDIVLEAIVEGYLAMDAQQMPYTDDVVADVDTWLAGLLSELHESADTFQIAQTLISAAAAADSDSASYREALFNPLYEDLKRRLAQENFRQSTELMAEMIGASLLWRLVLAQPADASWREKMRDFLTSQLV